MLGDQVRVITRRFNRDVNSSLVLEFRHGLGSRPNLRNAANSNEAPIDGGTRVEVRLKTNPFEPNGLLYRKDELHKNHVTKLGSVIAAIAPACDVSITVTEDNETQGIVAALDWLEISSSRLLNRILASVDIDEPTSTAKPWEKLTELRDEDGKLYGRARIDAGDYCRRPACSP
ncbi:MAG: hypothetical protein AcusKO_02810 [Acuticoccus sp.]